MKEPKIVKRTVEWFMRLQDHPRQRNTEKHADMATRRHLLDFFIAQMIVVVVKYLGKTYKVDGHTRTYLWQRGMLEKPTHVWVISYECDNEVDFVRLYKAHNNRHATEKISDLAYGRLHDLGLADITPAMQGKIAQIARNLMLMQTGLSSLPGDVAIEGMSVWFPQYRRFNQQLLDGTRIAAHTSLITAEFITNRLYGDDESDEFWNQYYHSPGGKIDDAYDGVAALNKMQMERRIKGQAKHGGGNVTLEMAGLALKFFEAYRSGQTFKRVPSQLREKQYRKWIYFYIQQAFGRYDLTRGDEDALTSPNMDPKAKVITDLPWEDID